MTGFGRAEVSEGGILYTLEVRSVNHRFLEINLKLAKSDLVHEDKIKARVKERISRGRLDLHLQRDVANNKALELSPDPEAIKGLVSFLRKMKEEFQLVGDVTLESVLNFKEIIFSRERLEKEPTRWETVEKLLDFGLSSLEEMRGREGAAIQRDFSQRLDKVEHLVGSIRERASSFSDEIRKKLISKVKALAADASWDENRLMQEAAVIATRSDISEELERLSSHLAQFRQSLTSNEPVGRHLEFILQELNREVNTLGSKLGDFPVSLAVVEIKSELEKFREQVQNLE